jgi:RHS repeat-associated protein
MAIFRVRVRRERAVRSARHLAVWRWRRLSALVVLVFLGALGAAGYQLAGATGSQPNGTCGFCLLEPSGEGLRLTGSGNVSLTKGNVIVNSSSKPAAALTASGSLKAPSVGVVGTASVTGSGEIENLTTGIAAISDPLAGLVVPSLTVPNPVPSVSVTGSTGKTVEPGVYKEITDTGSGSLTLNAGTYVILQKFANTGSGTLTAKGVMLYLACSSYPTGCKAGEKGATLALTGSGPMDFTGPEAGCSPVAVFSDRNSTAPLAITGSGSQILNGVIYAKSGSLALTGSGGTFTVGGPIVAGSAIISGSGGITLTGELPITEGLALVLSGSPASAHVGEAETLTATLSCHSKPLVGQPVSFTVTGANPHIETATTNASGVATFSYIGKATGSDTATASYTANGGSMSSKPATVTWSKAKPALATKPAASRVTLGEAISDAATLTGGSSPTGTVSFNVYSSTDTGCKTPLNEKPLTATLSGGVATSPKFTPSAPGTYQFLASYSGDQSNEAVAGTCGEASEQVKVEGSIGPIKAQPQSTTVDEGSSASFTASSPANSVATVQWQVSSNGGTTWANDTTDSATTSSESGNTRSTLTVESTTRSESGSEYRAIFTNAAGSATTNPAALTVDWTGPITTQPESKLVNEGQSVSFTAAASSNPTATVQWQLSTNGGGTWSNDATDSGNTTGTLTVSSAKTTQNGYEYRAVFTNVAGSVTSNAATLTVESIAAVTTQPQNQTVNEDTSASFTATADGYPTPSVQWQVSTTGGLIWDNDSTDKATSTPEAGQITSTLTVSSAVRSENGYEYRAIFTNTAGSATSNAATLTVDWMGPIESQPQSTTANEGAPVPFTAASSSNPAANVQWQFSTNAGSSWSNDTKDSVSTSGESGKTTSTLTLSSASRAQNGYEYRAVFTNAAGSTTSNAATLTVHWIGPVAPQPESRTVNEGQSTSLTAAAAANPAAGVQWQLSSNGGSSWSNDTSDTASTSSESGKTTSTLTIAGASRAQNGYEYRAIFTNAAGSATSNAASLTVDWIGPVSTQPESQATAEGKTISLTAAASANPSASAQWQFSNDSGAEWSNDTTDSANTTNSGGTTTSTLTIASAKHSQSGYEYRALFTNPVGTTTSSAATVMVEPAGRCTDTYDGPSGGLWQTPSNWSTGNIPTSSDVACVGPGTTVDVTGGTNAAGVLLDQGGLAMLGGSLELSSPAELVSIPGLEVSTTSTLNLSGGILSLGGTLNVASSLSGSGQPEIAGTGKLVLQPGASGTLDGGGCNTYPVLSGATFVNDGTFTFGAPGGSDDGAFLMSNGAQILNAGTFNDDAYDPGCGRGYGGSSIEDLGGTQPSITNTGSFNVNLGSGGSSQIGVGFLNDGSVRALAGSVSFSGGGIEEQVATGCWYAESGAALNLSGGTFVIEEGGTFQATAGSGAKATFTANGLSGSLEAQPYAAGTVTLKGHGEESNAQFVFAHATIEARPKGTGEWKSIGAALIPDSGGNFSVQWNTASGSYPDGHYQVRAKVSNNCACEKSVYTTPSGVRVANSPLVLSPSKGGPDAIGTSQAFTARLSGVSGEPLTGETVELHVTGANPKTLRALTNSEGEASFSYTGEAEGADKVQASYAPSDEPPITSNTASVSWFLAQREVSSTPVQGNFYPANDSASGFSAKPGDTPAFSQTFPTINFNPEAANPTVVGDVENGEGGPFSGAGSVAFSGQGALLSAQTPIKAQANWTLEAWIDPAKLNQEGMVIYNGDHGGGNGFGFGVFGQNGSPGGCLTGLYELVTWINTNYCFSAANRWYYLAEVNVEGTVTFYVNGTQVYRSSEPTPYAPSGQMIGGYGASGRTFYGQISNTAFYPRPLSATEIQAHYNASQAPNVSQLSYGGAIESSAPAAFYALSRVPHNTDPWFVTPETRPFTDLTTDETGAVNGEIPAEGNDLKAGLGSLETFEASFTANFVVAQAGDVTFKVTSENGFMLGVGGGASRVSGPYEDAPSSNESPFQSLPLVAVYNKSCCATPQTYMVTVHFPAPGSYPYELDYFQHGGQQATLTMETATVAATSSPLSIFAGYADSVRPASGIFPFPWEGSPGVIFEGCEGSCERDGGAVRIVNNTSSPELINSVTVHFGTCEYDIWPHDVELAGLEQLIIDQTKTGSSGGCTPELGLMDSSDIGPNGSNWAGNCTHDDMIPEVDVTANGTETTYYDTGQILNTGGVDSGECPISGANESEPWQLIGGSGGTEVNTPMPPSVSLELSPSMVSGDQVGQTQNVSIRARNAGGAAVAGLHINVHIYGPNAQNISLITGASGVAEGSYVGHVAGKDNISATASVEGLQVASNQLIVPWAIPVEPPPPPPPTEVSEGEVPGGEPPSVEIITPFGGSIVTGSMPVVGYVSGEEDARWSLTLSPAGGDATPVQLASGTGSVELGTLGIIEASKFGEGSYTLALTASTPGGSATENVPLTIGSKPGIPPPPPTETSSGAPTLSDESPASGSVIGVTTAVSAHATAPEGQTISGWTVTLTPLGEGTPTVLAETTAEHPSTLATIEPEEFKSGTYALMIEVHASGGGYATSSATVTLGVGVAPPAEEHKEEKGKEETKEEEHKEETKEEKEHKEEHKEEKETTHVASPPEIGEVAPASGTVVTAPTPITAHVSAPSGESIASWSVAYQGTEQHATTFASGQGAPPETLATFDPTKLANGDYKITVTATTTGGAVQSESTSLTVSGNLKLGRYLETYKDLEIPVAGFNMDVERVYDSTNKSVGDFGIGWNLMLSNFKVQTNGPLGEGGWVQREAECLFGEPTESELGEEEPSGLCAYAYESRPQHTVTVTLPDGQTEVFVFEPHGEYFNNLEVLPRFSAKAGTNTTSTLEVDEPTEILNGFNGSLYEGDFENPWTAQTFMLTTRTGMKYVLNTERGVISEEDLNHNKLTFTPNGIESSAGPKLTLTRDSQGRITEINGPSEQHLHYGYDNAGDLTSYTDADGNTTTYAYNNEHDLLTTTGPGSSKPLQKLIYNEEGRLSEAIDGEGHATKISDAIGTRTETVIDPNGKLTTINSYDELGDVVERQQVYEGHDLETKYSYDSEGRLLSTTDPLGNTSTDKWDGDNLASETNADGDTTSYEYNAENQLIAVIGTHGTREVSIARNASGEPTSVKRAGEPATEYVYGADGKPTSITHPSGTNEVITYDSNGNPATITNGAGATTRLTYNASAERIAETSPTGATTTYGYDGEGNETSITNAAGAKTTFTYNAFGGQLSETDPLGHTETSTYDEAGRLTGVTDANGVTTTFSYNADGLPVREASSNGEETVASYDPVGRLESIANSEQALGFRYDSDGQVITATTSAIGPAPATTLTYQYDAAGQRVSMGGPDGTSSYGYDEFSHLTSLVPSSEPSGSPGFGFSYSDGGVLEGLTRPNGIDDARTYKGEELLSVSSNSKAGTVARTSYEYGPTGLKSGSTSQAGGTVGYSYDPMQELVEETQNGLPSAKYEYDPVGNRTGGEYDEANELVSDSSDAYTYDADGQLIKRVVKATGATTTFSWNARHELVSVTLPDGSTETIAYDPLGRRISTSHAGTTDAYVYDGANVHLEYDGSGTGPSAVYTDGQEPNQVLEMDRDGHRYSYITDGLGSTIALANESGDVVQRYSYDAFGNQQASGTIPNPFTYTGQAWDPVSGLYYYGARYYDPELGRFISKDPIRHTNPYAYVGNDPVNATDPTGADGTEGEEVAAIADESILDDEEASITLQSVENDVDRLFQKALEEDRGGLTRVGRSIAKHSSEFPGATGNPDDLNAYGQEVLEEILTDPETVIESATSGNFPGGFKFFSSEGFSATFDAEGIFRYFGTSDELP